MSIITRRVVIYGKRTFGLVYNFVVYNKRIGVSLELVRSLFRFFGFLVCGYIIGCDSGLGVRPRFFELFVYPRVEIDVIVIFRFVRIVKRVVRIVLFRCVVKRNFFRVVDFFFVTEVVVGSLFAVRVVIAVIRRRGTG